MKPKERKFLIILLAICRLVDVTGASRAFGLLFVSEQGEQGELGEHAENAKFTTYPHENKQLMNLVNFVRKYFGVPRTWRVKAGVGEDSRRTAFRVTVAL